MRPDDACTGAGAAPPFAADAPLFIVLNANSGKDDAGETRETIRAVLGEARRRYRLFVCEPRAGLSAVARQAVASACAEQGAVVAAGGDGTLNAVAQEVLGSGCAFGVLPQGTFNYFGRNHGIPNGTAEAMRMLVGSRPQPVQVGLVNDHVFLVNASLGLYPQLLENREAWKKQYGRHRLVAFGSALATLLREHRQLRIRVEREGKAHMVRTPTLFVGNNRLQLEQIGIEQTEALASGRLAAVMPKPVGSWAMLGLVVRGALGRLGDAEQIDHFGFSQLSVSPAAYGGKRIKIASDGEIVWMRAPLLFRVSPKPLWLLKSDAAVGERA